MLVDLEDMFAMLRLRERVDGQEFVSALFGDVGRERRWHVSIPIIRQLIPDDAPADSGVCRDQELLLYSCACLKRNR